MGCFEQCLELRLRNVISTELIFYGIFLCLRLNGVCRLSSFIQMWWKMGEIRIQWFVEWFKPTRWLIADPVNSVYLGLKTRLNHFGLNLSIYFVSNIISFYCTGFGYSQWRTRGFWNFTDKFSKSPSFSPTYPLSICFPRTGVCRKYIVYQVYWYMMRF